MIDLLQFPGFVDGASLPRILHELDASHGAQATLLGRSSHGADELRTRRSTRLDVSDALREEVRAQLMARIGELSEHFGVTLTECEPPQFLRYEVGDYFVAHQDGNTPLVHDDSRFRRVSAVVFLSTPSEADRPDTYGGGALVFHGPYTGPMLRVPVTPEPGTLVAFRSETTHEVAPVTHGVRYTIVSWFR